MTPVTLLLALLAQAAAPRVAPAPVRAAVARVNDEPVLREDLLALLVAEYRATPDGSAILNHLVDEEVLRREIRTRGIRVTDEEVARACARLSARVRRESGGAEELDALLKAREVDAREFRGEMRHLVALEKIVRAEERVPEREEVEPERLQAWLSRLRARLGVDLFSPDLPPGAVARVGDDLIGEAAFGEEVLRSLSRAERERQLNRLIGLTAVRQALRRAGIEVTEEAIGREIERRRERHATDPRLGGLSYEKSLAIRGRTIEEERRSPEFQGNVGLLLLVGRDTPEADLRARFERDRALYGPTIRVRHILIQGSAEKASLSRRTLEEAGGIIAEIEAELGKGADFGELARERSEDRSRFQGGDVGWIRRGGPADAHFVEAAFALRVGETSRPVRTRFGVHLIQVTGFRPAPEFDEARGEVLEELAKERFRELIREARIERFLDGTPPPEPGR